MSFREIDVVRRINRERRGYASPSSVVMMIGSYGWYQILVDDVIENYYKFLCTFMEIVFGILCIRMEVF